MWLITGPNWTIPILHLTCTIRLCKTSRHKSFYTNSSSFPTINKQNVKLNFMLAKRIISSQTIPSVPITYIYHKNDYIWRIPPQNRSSKELLVSYIYFKSMREINISHILEKIIITRDLSLSKVSESYERSWHVSFHQKPIFIGREPCQLDASQY